MKQYVLRLLPLIMALFLGASPALAATRHHTPHHAAHHHAVGVDRSAGYSDIVIDAESGRVVHDTDSDELRHPASLTKMMTLYLTFQALEAQKLTLDQYIPVSENASYQSPSKLGLHAGSRIKVQDAILGIVTESANDAAVTLGEALGGSEEGFAALMTRQAHVLGMKNTVFRNPSGLPDPDQVTTAHDMAVLGAALLNHYPEYYPFFSHNSFTYAGIYHHNHNHLMDRYDGMDGIKTGYIRASGFNLVASAKHGGIRLIGVVFGGHSAVARDNRMAQLLDQSFDVARAERNSNAVVPSNGEGDSGDSDNRDYIALPAKIAAIFPSRNALPDAPVPDVVEAPQAAVAVAPPAPTSPVTVAPAHASVAKPAPVRKPAVPVHVAAPVAPAPAQVSTVHYLVPPHSTKNWGIQIGAYPDSAVGQQALADLTASMPGVLANADPQMQPVSAGGTTMYRARLMALDKKTAQSVCSYLLQHGKSCLTVEP